jgi:hypothetical protein
MGSAKNTDTAIKMPSMSRVALRAVCVDVLSYMAEYVLPESNNITEYERTRVGTM